MQKSVLAWAVLALSIALFVGPFLVPPFMGYTDDVLLVPQPEPAIQPAGYAFAIWGVIYAWLIASAAYGVWKHSDDLAWRPARIAVIPALAIGAVWTGIAGLSAVWGTITIWIMLGFAVVATMRAPWANKWWMKAPYALFAGWLSAASFVSLGVTLPGFGILFTATPWAVICIFAATVLACAVQLRLGAMPTYAIAVVWGLVGIIVGNSGGVLAVSIVAAFGALCVAIAAYQTYRRT